MRGKKKKMEEKKMKFSVKDRRLEFLDFEKQINHLHVRFYHAQFNVDNMIDYISCNGGLKVKDLSSIHLLVAQLIILPSTLEEEFKPKTRLEYCKLKVEGVKRIAKMMEEFVDEQFVDVDWGYFTDEEKKDILKQTLIDWAISYIISALEIKRRKNFSNMVGKGGMN